MMQLRTQAVKMMTDEGVAAIITPTRDGGDGGGTGIIFDDNGANLVRNAQKPENAVKIPNAVMMIEHYNRLARMADGARSRHGRGEHRHQVHRRPRAWLRHGRGDSGHRSEAEGRGGDGRRPPRQLDLRHRRDR